MQVLHEWPGESRKRAAEEIVEQSSRKRSRDDDNARHHSIGNAITHQEYKIRGNATIDKEKELYPNLSVSSPIVPSPPSPSIHPDRRANIFNATSTPPVPTPLHNKRDYPWSPLSRSPEHINNKAEPEEQRCK